MNPQIDKQKDKRKRIIAIILWLVIGAGLGWIFCISRSPFDDTGNFLMFLLMPGWNLGLTVITIISVLLYYNANKNEKNKKKLWLRSGILFTISLAMLVVTVLLFAPFVTSKGILPETALMLIMWFFLAPITGFLSFLITSIKLMKLAERSSYPIISSHQ